MKNPPTSPSAPSARPVVLVAIAGGSGSGKTWLATALRRRLRPLAGLISLDDFYRDLSHLPKARRARINFDSPAAIDWPAFEAALRAIRAGGEPLLPRYNFAEHTRSTRTHRWRQRPIVVIEGLWPWVNPRLRSLFALRIFRAADGEMRYERRLRRDQQQRGRSAAAVDRQWRSQVEPMFLRHVAPQKRSADLILDARVGVAELTSLARQIARLVARDRRSHPRGAHLPAGRPRG